MATITAGDIMTKQVLTAKEDWTVKHLAAFLVEHGITGLPVVSADESMVGVVSASDIVFTDAGHADDEDCTVDQIMSNRVIKVDEMTPLDEIARIMLDNGIRRVFVDREGTVVGVVSTTNILQAIVVAAS